MQLYDEVRIDHFRAFAGYYTIDAEAETAMNGVWQVGPRMGFFDGIKKRMGDVAIIAEACVSYCSDGVEDRQMFTCYTIIQRIASYIRERMTMTLFWGGTRRSMKERGGT